MNSILLIDNDKILRESEAVLHILKVLGVPWKWFTAFDALPRSWTDALYKLIAKNRYRWFGKKESCTLSMDQYENRFILATDEPILE